LIGIDLDFDLDLDSTSLAPKVRSPHEFRSFGAKSVFQDATQR
jgi:hypothetical protein